jgi:hypothetical protein
MQSLIYTNFIYNDPVQLRFHPAALLHRQSRRAR